MGTEQHTTGHANLGDTQQRGQRSKVVVVVLQNMSAVHNDTPVCQQLPASDTRTAQNRTLRTSVNTLSITLAP